MAVSDKAARLRYLDWTRGLAALIMLQGHTFHAFTRTDLRDKGPFVLSQFFGGIAPAVFLFLTGATLAFRMHSDERAGMTAGARVLSALRRAGYLATIAFLFRIQLWAFSAPYSNWTDILKVDILNCMALTIAVLSLMAVFSTAERARLCSVLGVVIAAAAPLVSQLDWSATPAIVKDYLNPDYFAFSFFPWGAYLAFGLSAGSVIRLLRDEQMDRAMLWSAWIGAALIAGGHFFSEIPYSIYPKSEFWLNSPWLVFMKLGVLLWMLVFAFLWTRYAAPQNWSWVAQLGTTSLLVYWVHIELVYGRWLGRWKESLDNATVVVVSVVVLLLMLGLSVARTYGKTWSARPAALRWYPFPSQRISGD